MSLYLYSAVSAALAVAAAEPSAKKEAVRFTLDPARRVYEVGVNFAYQTTVWTPVDCEHPAIGDPEYFALLFDPSRRLQRRFIVTAQVDKPGATTNVTFDCVEGVRIVLKVTQVPPEEAALSVEFAFDAAENARVRAAVAAERQRANSDCEDRIVELRDAIDRETHDRFVRGMLRRLLASDDVEYARQDFVVVKVSRQLLVGDRGYIIFSVQNQTNNDVVIKDIEVLDEAHKQPLANASLVMRERRVPPDATVLAVAAFDCPDDAAEFTLVVHEDGPRNIRVNDIEL